MPSMFSRLVALGCCFALLACGSVSHAAVVANAVGALIAGDTNVNSFAIGIPAGSVAVAASGNFVDFASGGDGFGFAARDDGNEAEFVINGDPPFAQLDDSTTFGTDTVGTIQSGDFDNFFGVTDTVNAGNPNGGSYTATWEFDISGASGGLTVNVDAAAMGDFETADVFDFDYSFDGGATFSSLYTSVHDDTVEPVGGYVDVVGGSNIDLTAPNQDPVADLPAEIVYTLESGSVIGWVDPWTLNGTFLDNSFQTVSQAIGTTASSTLQIRFTAFTDGGSEGFLFRNLTVEDGGAAELAGDANGDGVVDLLDLDILGTNFGASPATFAQGDFNGDNVVDLLDLDILGTNFGDTAAVAVPEPTAVLLLLIGLTTVAARRKN